MSEQRETARPARVTPPVTPPPRDSDTVTIACKLPNGYVLHGEYLSHEYEPIMGGGQRELKIWRRTDEAVVLNGNAIDKDAYVRGDFDRTIVGGSPAIPGYALTYGVSKKFWLEWLSRHKDDFVIVNNLIFASDGENNARAQAKEQQAITSGLEPIDPDKPSAKSRELRGIKKGTEKDDD